MPLPASGSPISLSQLQTEFGGSNPIKMSEYYRGGGLTTNNNTDVPTDGTIELGDFASAAKAVQVLIELIGGGGGGGYGVEDFSGTGNAESGYASSVTLSNSYDSFNYTAAGGAGGANGNLPWNAPTPGEASHYGPGGAKSYRFSSRHAPSTSYGAAGAGGFGDQAGLGDTDGDAGTGGQASDYQSHNELIVVGSTVSVVVGRGGEGDDPPDRGSGGGDGADGYVKFTVGNHVTEYFYNTADTNQSSHTFTVPS